MRQSANSGCHAEFISGSVIHEIPKRVRKDKYFLPHPNLYANLQFAANSTLSCGSGCKAEQAERTVQLLRSLHPAHATQSAMQNRRGVKGAVVLNLFQDPERT